MISRRQFLKYGAAAGAGVMLASHWSLYPRTAHAFSHSDKLIKFVQPLRGVGASGIPVAQPDTAVKGWWQPGVTHYTIDIGQFTDQLHPELPNPTRLWGFGQNGNFKHLGGIIATKRGAPVQITFRNNLPPAHIIPVDTTLMGADGPQNRVDIHLHGGLVPWISDGGPHAWWDPNGNRGPSFVNVLKPGLKANEAEYYYPNNQGARLEWYHDHAFGITRLSAYAGIASGYVIYDDYELSLAAANNLPGPLDPRTVYLIFQDKIFVSQTTADADPTWYKLMPNSRQGDLWYAHTYEPERWELEPAPAGLPPDPSCIPEFFGDTILVNGTVYPYLEVEQRQYRLRLLNACNARFLNPRFVYAKGTSFPDDTESSAHAGPALIQIGSEGGFLAAPAMLNGPGQPTLLLAPAERADLIVDFRNVLAGSTLILLNDAAAPYPGPDERNDYYPGNPKNKTASTPGYGPNTRTLLQVRVKARKGAADAPITLPAVFTPTDPFLVKQSPGVPVLYTLNADGSAAAVTLSSGISVQAKVRHLTLNETSDEHGRLIQFLGTNQSTGSDSTGALLFGREYMDTPTEVVPQGSYEIWEIANLTGDTHPIHFHLVNVQVLSRQAFAVKSYASTPSYQGQPVGPDPNELGWKETVRMNPGQVTRVLMKFEIPAVPFTVPPSPRLQKQYGITGAEYVWHCHILEHEEHDMMRPLVVQ